MNLGRNVLDHESCEPKNLGITSFVSMDDPTKIYLVIFGTYEHLFLLRLLLFGFLSCAFTALPLGKILLHELGLLVVGLHLGREVVIALLDAILIKLLMLNLLG